MALNMSVAGQVLSVQQKQHYDEQGFLIVKNLVPQNKIDKYAQRFAEICTNAAPVPSMTVMRDISIAKSEFKEGEQAITKLQNFQDDPQLFDYCKLPQIIAIVIDLIGGPNIMAMHTMLINKPPDTGQLTSRHPLHQDLHYFPFRPAERICCSWTAMERVYRDNGCLVLLPRSHKRPLLPHQYPKWQGGVNKAYHGIEDYDRTEAMFYAEMQSGDTVFFHPLLIHGSGTNRTKGFRKAISCHYANGSQCQYVDVRGGSQQLIVDEVLDMARAKYGRDIQLQYQDVWQIKGRQVHGVRANL